MAYLASFRHPLVFVNYLLSCCRRTWNVGVSNRAGLCFCFILKLDRGMKTFLVHTSLANMFTCFINLNVDEVSCGNISWSLLFLSLIVADAKSAQKCVCCTHAILYANWFCMLAFTSENPSRLWISLAYDVNKWTAFCFHPSSTCGSCQHKPNQVAFLSPVII